VTPADLSDLQQVLAAYSAASRDYAEAKRVFREREADLRRQIEDARKPVNDAFDRMKAAGDALTRFTDDNPDPDEEPEEDGE
jgi:hypothetical protein